MVIGPYFGDKACDCTLLANGSTRDEQFARTTHSRCADGDQFGVVEPYECLANERATFAVNLDCCLGRRNYSGTVEDEGDEIPILPTGDTAVQKRRELGLMVRLSKVD